MFEFFKRKKKKVPSESKLGILPCHDPEGCKHFIDEQHFRKAFAEVQAKNLADQKLVDDVRESICLLLQFKKLQELSPEPDQQDEVTKTAIKVMADECCEALRQSREHRLRELLAHQDKEIAEIKSQLAYWDTAVTQIERLEYVLKKFEGWYAEDDCPYIEHKFCPCHTDLLVDHEKEMAELDEEDRYPFTPTEQCDYQTREGYCFARYYEKLFDDKQVKEQENE